MSGARRAVGGSVLLIAALTAIGAAGCGDGDTDTTTGAETTTTTAETVEKADLTAIPLGDGKISEKPKVDNVYSCEQDFDNQAGGALVDGPWINEKKDTWNAKEKVAVPGKVDQPDAEFDVKQSGNTRTLSGNDLPTDETTGEYPIPEDSEAYEYDRNPNTIQTQEYEVDLLANPKKADQPSCVSLGAVGIMLDGVYFFDALDGPGRDAVAHEIQDRCDGHPEASGAYHYHSESACTKDPGPGKGHSPLIGYAIDGFGLYGHFGEDGDVLTNDDLDACHGHTHEIEWDGETKRLYHYHATYEYPYTVACFRGEPSEDEDLGAAPSEGAGGAGGPSEEAPQPTP